MIGRFLAYYLVFSSIVLIKTSFRISKEAWLVHISFFLFKYLYWIYVIILVSDYICLNVEFSNQIGCQNRYMFCKSTVPAHNVLLIFITYIVLPNML